MLQNFKPIEHNTSEILHFIFSWSYLNENEAKNLHNGDVDLAQIPNFKMYFCIFHALSFELNLIFDGTYPLSFEMSTSL